MFQLTSHLVPVLWLFFLVNTSNQNSQIEQRPFINRLLNHYIWCGKSKMDRASSAVKNRIAFPAESLLSICTLCSKSFHGVSRHSITLKLVSLDVLRVVVVEDSNNSEHVGTTELYWTRKRACMQSKPLQMSISKYNCYYMHWGSLDVMKPGGHVALACNCPFTRKCFTVTFQPKNRGSIPGRGRTFYII
jgi:hypothetical protein